MSLALGWIFALRLLGFEVELNLNQDENLADEVYPDLARSTRIK